MRDLPYYSPIIRTTAAELLGYEKLTDEVRSNILPVFELTRSRPNKEYPEGNIHQRMRQIEDSAKDMPFILDLTSTESLMNTQVEELFDDSNNFKKWREFLEGYSHLNVIPVVHVFLDEYELAKNLAGALLEKHDLICLKLSGELLIDEVNEILSGVLSNPDISDRVIVLYDFDYVDEFNFSSLEAVCIKGLESISSFNPNRVIIASSSFPLSVLDRVVDENADHEGEMTKLEKEFFKSIKDSYSGSVELVYGDHASAHPHKRSVKGGNWVPRVDVVSEDSYIYKRFRREHGGFAKAAREMIKWHKYNAVQCWGRDEIELAAAGSPSGKSPAFWISVRVNQHLTRSVMHDMN